jgi:enoyl-CoA hydratase
MPASYETLLVTSPAPHVALVTMNRPEASNAVHTAMGTDMLHYFEELSLDPGDVRCVVLTGAGDKAFCAGGDLKERRGMTDEAWQRQHIVFERKVRAVMACPVPVIAAVNGAAYGGGCETALQCDFIYASTTARFALTEVTLGIMPGAGGTQNMPRAVGTRRALEVILTGAPFTAAQGLEWGMINRVLPPAELMAATLDTAAKIAANAPVSTRQAKQAVHRGIGLSIWDGLAVEIEAYNRTVPTQDRREGVLAYNEKRKPVFTGR